MRPEGQASQPSIGSRRAQPGSRATADKIILLNGASSSGKSTIAGALQASLAEPFWHYSFDHLAAGGVLPRARLERGDFAWSSMRPKFFEGFHRSIPALATAGNHLIVDHIVEEQAWMDRLLRLLEHRDVFFVGVHCPVDDLERRERRRGDRRIGDARSDAAVTHTFGGYDLEVEGTAPSEAVAGEVIAAWLDRRRPSAFSRMLEERRRSGARALTG